MSLPARTPAPHPRRTLASLLVLATTACDLPPDPTTEVETSAATLNRPAQDVLGFVGGGMVEMTNKIGTLSYVSIGNQIDRTTIQNLTPASDPNYGLVNFVVRRIAKLDGRLDGLGYSYAQQEADVKAHVTAVGKNWVLPLFYDDPGPFRWWSPNPQALIAADRSQIVAAIRRDRAAGKSGVNVWEISNEPNLFPSITAQQYGSLVAEYAQVIRQEDPAARVAVGGLWSPDLIMDKAVFRQVLVDAAKSKALAGQPDIIPNSYLRQIGTAVGNEATDRILRYGGKAAGFLKAALDSIPNDVASRIGPIDVSVHVYPFDARRPASDASVVTAMNTMIAEVAAAGAAFNARINRPSAPRVYVTEFGNIVADKTQAAVRARTQAITTALVNSSQVAAAYWFKGIGIDAPLASLFGGVAPYSRLIDDPNYVFPNPADTTHPFPCVDFNSIGHYFYQLVHAKPCQDGLLPAPARGFSFDGDDFGDLAFFEPGSSTMHVARSTGTTFDVRAARVWLNAGPNGNRKDSYLPGDFNGDNRVDLGFLGADDSFTVHFSAGNTFELIPPRTWLRPQEWGGNWGRYYVGDFNKDRKDDLAFFEPGDRSLHVNISTGNGAGGAGSGQWLVAPAGATARDIHIGDFDGDGAADFLFVHPTNHSVHVALTARTPRAFALWNAAGTVGGAGDVYYIGHFSNDNRSDLVVASASRVRITASTGSTFSNPYFASSYFPSPLGFPLPRPDKLLLADVNADGKTDLAYPTTDNRVLVGLTLIGPPFRTDRVSTWVFQNQFGHVNGTYYLSKGKAQK